MEQHELLSVIATLGCASIANNSEKSDMKRLEYRLCKDRHGAPLITLDSPMGNGQDISPSNLRKLANALLEVAEAAEQTKLGKHESWKSGVIELE